MQLITRALELLFTAGCAACDRPCDGGLCEVCSVSLLAVGPACPRCAEPGDGVCRLCRVAPPPFARMTAPFVYGGELAVALRRLKFDGHREVARALAPLVAPSMVRAAREVDVVIPVPLHRRRLARRGFNQAALLVKHARLDRPVDVLSLERVRATVPQSGLDRLGRRRNVEGAFAVAPGRVAQVAGRAVLLVDDVATTGATLVAAARALRASGAAEVTAYCVARAES